MALERSFEVESSKGCWQFNSRSLHGENIGGTFVS